MHFVNIHDAKTNLSKYLEQVVNSHEAFVICRNGKPVAMLTEYVTPRHRKIGLLRKKIKIKDDFDELPGSFMENFA